MKKKLIAITLLAVLPCVFFSGCGTSLTNPIQPINTQLTLEGEGFPLVDYKSEKDVIYERTVLPDGTEEVKFQAIASAPAMADAERAALALQQQIQSQEALLEAFQATMQMVPWAIGTYKQTPVYQPPQPQPAPVQPIQNE